MVKKVWYILLILLTEFINAAEIIFKTTNKKNGLKKWMHFLQIFHGIKHGIKWHELIDETLEKK